MLNLTMLALGGLWKDFEVLCSKRLLTTEDFTIFEDRDVERGSDNWRLGL